jgi:hypothetical protein
VVIYYGGKIQAQGTLRELLASPDQVRITTPLLSRETTERVLQILRTEVGDKVRLDNPTQNLESYFLGVVERARRQSETSGATSGNQVAEYLRSGQASAGGQTASVLDRLSKPEAPETPAPVVHVPDGPSADERLASLTRHEPPSPALAETAAPKPEEAPVDLNKANDKLSGLLGGKK